MSFVFRGVAKISGAAGPCAFTLGIRQQFLDVAGCRSRQDPAILGCQSHPVHPEAPSRPLGTRAQGRSGRKHDARICPLERARLDRFPPKPSLQSLVVAGLGVPPLIRVEPWRFAHRGSFSPGAEPNHGGAPPPCGQICSA